MPPQSNTTRREFLKRSGLFAAGLGGTGTRLFGASAKGKEHFFITRGVVIVPNDLKGLDWPALAHKSGLTTIGMHGVWGAGAEFLEECKQLGLHVEYELHAMNSLLPRELFAKDP